MLPHLIGQRGPGVYVAPSSAGGGGGTSDGGFTEPPVVTTTASGNTTVKGKVKPGSFGKFVYPLAVIAAGRQYTFRFTPHFAQLAQQGKLAMVGFGLKNGNDFHIVGLRGDGSTGVHKYKVYGTPPNGWNAQTGHTTSDGGASANGTQAGPNYIRLVVSADGATYTFQTSPDGSTWTDEYTVAAPSPFSNVSGVATFGIALWFNNADAGPFSIDIDQFADAAAPDPFLAFVSGFEGSNGSTSFVDEGPNHLTVTAFGNAQITTAQFKIGASCLLVDGSGDSANIADATALRIGSSEFTLEGFFRFSAHSGTVGLINKWNVGNPEWGFFFESGALHFRAIDFGSTQRDNTGYTFAPTLNQWYHIAVDRTAAGILRQYVDGVMVTKNTGFTYNIRGDTNPVTIGRVTGFSAYDMNGWADECRISNGVARYASDAGFTVPTAAYPRS